MATQLYRQSFPSIMEAALLTQVISSREIDILMSHINKEYQRIDYAERFQKHFEPCRLREADFLTHKALLARKPNPVKGRPRHDLTPVEPYTSTEEWQAKCVTEVQFVGVHYKTSDWLTPVYQVIVDGLEGFEYYVDNSKLVVLK